MRRPGPILLLLAGTQGCLILDPVDFPAPENQLPTVVESNPEVAEVLRVDRTLPGNLRFELRVFDGNEEDELDARAFVDFADDPSILNVPNVERDDQGDARIRVVTTGLSLLPFTRGCHVVEIDVIDDRAGWVPDDVRAVQGDVGKVTGTWFVLAHDHEQSTEILLEDCPTRELLPEGGGQ